MHAPAIQSIPAELLLLAYRGGVFPMADSRNDPDVFWVEPRERAIIPLESFRPSASLRKTIRQGRYRVSCDEAFGAVMQACAAPRPKNGGEDAGSWISHRIEASYRQLNDIGHAHSVECWAKKNGGDTLVGGLYGVSFDRVFCGESMFSRADNASKVALAWLVAAMRHAGFVLLDCQFMTGHLASLGAIEMSQADYVRRVGEAAGEPRLTLPQAFSSLLSSDEAGAGSSSRLPSPGKRIAQSFTQTS